MFCKICGKEYNEGSQFCIYCGAKIEPADTACESISQPVSEIPAPAVSAVEAPVSQPAQAVPAEANTAAVPPMPEPISSSVSYGNVESVMRPVERSNTGVSSYNFTVAEPPKPEKPEKYYTFGHLALCLAAVAVMAIVAGVFAGLYFSAIA